MIELRSFTSRMQAVEVLLFLVGRGLHVQIASRQDPTAPPLVPSPDLCAVTCNEADAAAALQALAEFDASPPQHEQGWEEGAARPDLSRLDPLLRPLCPACASPLRVSAQPQRCPGCGSRHDLLNLIVDQFGPEALAPCYPSDEQAPCDPATLTALILTCRDCGYSLGGLPGCGLCPECGLAYDKLRMLMGQA